MGLGHRAKRRGTTVLTAIAATLFAATAHAQQSADAGVAAPPESAPTASSTTAATTPADAQATPSSGATTTPSTTPNAGTTANTATAAATTTTTPPGATTPHEPQTASPASAHAATNPHPRGGDDHGPPATVTARLGHGVTFTSADDAFSLTIRARAQARFTLLSAAPGSTDLPATEFQIRRARLLFQGHFFSRAWQYYIQLGFSNLDTESDLRLPLRDAYLTWSSVRDLNIRVGQMKVPFGRQRVVSSSSLQMVDRSIVTGELNLDRDVGIQVFSTNLFGLNNMLGYQLGVFGGDGRNRLSTSFGMLYVARLQFTPFGRFDDFVEADVERLSRPRLAIGIAAAYNQNSRRRRSTHEDTFALGGFDYRHIGADMIFKLAGFSLQAEFMIRSATENFHDGAQNGMPMREYSRSAWGYYVQAGYLFTRHAEVSARWGDLVPMADTDPSFRRQRELGGGLSWYFQEHAFKVQADYFYLFGDNFDAGRHQARIQMQLYF